MPPDGLTDKVTLELNTPMSLCSKRSRTLALVTLSPACVCVCVCVCETTNQIFRS